MIDQDIELMLLANQPIELGNGLRFVAPTLKQIAGVGSKKYDGLISVLLVNKDAFEELPSNNYTHFEFFLINCIMNAEFWRKAKQGLELFFNLKPALCEDPDDAFIYFDDHPDARLDNDNFDYFQSLIIYSHNIKFAKDDFQPANSKARALIEKLQKGKHEILSKKEQIFDLSSKISGIAWKSNAVNIFNVFDMTIYQFYDALNRLEQVDHYLFTLQGIYAGTVDSQKINLSNLHWSKKIKSRGD